MFISVWIKGEVEMFEFSEADLFFFSLGGVELNNHRVLIWCPWFLLFFRHEYAVNTVCLGDTTKRRAGDACPVG